MPTHLIAGNLVRVLGAHQSVPGFLLFHHVVRATGQVLGEGLQHASGGQLEHQAHNPDRSRTNHRRLKLQRHLLRAPDQVTAELTRWLVARYHILGVLFASLIKHLTGTENRITIR